MNTDTTSSIHHTSLSERRVAAFETIEYTVNNGYNSLQFTLLESASFITKIFIPHRAFSKIVMLTIGSSSDDKHFSYTSYSAENAPKIDKYYCMIELNVEAKTLVFQAAFSYLKADDLDIFAML